MRSQLQKEILLGLSYQVCVVWEEGTTAIIENPMTISGEKLS